ncbi:MAG: hypothetical protein HY290_33255, partial [Planctomycetia bacterium]|nr:hypothetical protein [Planctomycetia bacterium]
FAAPAAVIAISGFDIVYPRHFLVPMIFGYVAVGNQCVRGWQRGQAGRWAVAMLLAGFVGCNAVPVARLIAGGRSQDRAALFWIAEQTSGPVVTFSGDHDFRVEMVMVWFHGARNEPYFRSLGKSLKYVPKDAMRQEPDEGPAEGTEWRLLHSSSEWQAPPAAQIKDDRGIRYELVKTFPCSSISGWTWWVYHRSM